MKKLSEFCTVINADALKALAELEPRSIDLILTSPPFAKDSMIEEKSIYFSAILDQLKRVLKPAGVIWINFNDFYKADRTERENADNIKTVFFALIRSSCPEGGTVLDPFMGDGAVGIAALHLGRKFIGIDHSLEACGDATDNLIKNI